MLDMIPRSYRIKQLLLVFGDLFVFQTALVLALLLRYGAITAGILERHVGVFFVISLLWCVTFYINHLYSLEPQSPFHLIRRFSQSMLVNFALAIAFFYLLPLGIEPRTNLFLHGGISLVLGCGWRIFAERVLIKGQKSRPFAYIGPSEHLPRAIELMQTNRFGYTLEENALSTEEMRLALNERRVRGILVPNKLVPDRSLRDLVHTALFLRVPILDLIDLEETSAGRIPLASLNDTWLLFHLKENEKALSDRAKRLIDVLCAIPFAFLTILLAPLLLLFNLFSNRGPLLYSQERVGLHAKPFRLWKFRTMRLDAEANGPRFSGGTDTDPRITSLGRWLRKIRLDELPQVWNVLRGELSFIGPRPERPEFVAPLLVREPLYALRHLTKPGLTGWAQVQYLKPNQTNEDNLVKLQYDLYYLKHRSLVLDALILLKTVGIVVRREGV